MTAVEQPGSEGERLWLPLSRPPWTPEAAGVEDAIAAYPTTQFAVAEDPWGKVAWWRPTSEPPHQLITCGRCGPQSATTAAVQTLAAQCAWAHWAVHIVAAGDVDSGYWELREWPNVRCVATSLGEMITAITGLQELLRQRLDHAYAGVGQADRNAPVVLLIDYWHQLLASARFTKSEHHKLVANALGQLIRLGRVVRIHVVLAGSSSVGPPFWWPGTDCDISELQLCSPYVDGFTPIYRRLGSLRPTRSSYPLLDLDTRHSRTPYGEVVDYPIVVRPGRNFFIAGGRGQSAPASDETSDIEVGRYAVRTFSIDRRRGTLVPVSIASHLDSIGVDSRAVWEDGVCVARCAHGHNHPAPSDDCSCGIYGATSLASLHSQFPDLVASIVAVIAAEGPTIIGNAGLRTSAARVVAYWCHPGPAFDAARTVLAQQCIHAQHFDVLTAMLAAYNIPATTVDADCLPEGFGVDWHQRISIGRIDQASADRFWSRPLRRHVSAVMRSVRWLAAKLAPAGHTTRGQQIKTPAAHKE
ncbi:MULTISPECIES: hypothetical protein [Mycobacteriaceae]|uniref:hypothetical protein n=1 Tax=Mycobacteriaceae TaxID=1762 RepID=UPI000268246F|nr:MULTISPECIES: hypothetical protein [Mycobacteriaceae]EIU51611.1 hypothetical protein MA6G0125S_5323 [Mycobacteroides abscessus 6G-0125-S]EIU64270.1 hypothetical protein MA6G0728S_5411 [Mycobacteroides abscessus 6G-0728-S]EIU74703.1 hypothetical protein MA6G1108_5327 [Mycobacteroides abscessus 6G-1108]